MYAIIKHGQVLATGTLEEMFISNIFPLSDTAEWKQVHDVYEVVFPQYDSQTQYLVQTVPAISGRQVVLHTVAEQIPRAQLLVDTPAIETISTNEYGADSVPAN